MPTDRLMRPGRGPGCRIAPTAPEQIARALTPRVFDEVEMARRDIRRALRALAAADRTLARAGMRGV